MMNQARVPSDPGVLAHLGQIANKQGDESQVCDDNYIIPRYIVKVTIT